MRPPFQKFAERIKKLAEDEGLSLDCLRDKVGIRQERFALLMNGLAAPAEQEILRFAAAFDVSPEALMGDGTDIESRNRERLLDYLRRTNESHRFAEVWPLVRQATHAASYRYEKPMDDRMFQSLLHDKGLTDYGWRDG